MPALLPLSCPRRRVLVAEDNRVIAEDLRAELDAAGVEVLGPVADLQRSIELLAGQPGLDAAILDIRLGGELAYPLADALSARGIPFIFATAWEARSIPAAYAGVPRCEKPYDAERCLQRLLGHAAAARGDRGTPEPGVGRAAGVAAAPRTGDQGWPVRSLCRGPIR